MARSYVNSIFNLFEELPYCFLQQLHLFTLHSHQQYTRVLISLPPHQHLLFCFFFFYNNHSDGCEVVSHCGFIYSYIITNITFMWLCAFLPNSAFSELFFFGGGVIALNWLWEYLYPRAGNLRTGCKCVPAYHCSEWCSPPPESVHPVLYGRMRPDHLNLVRFWVRPRASCREKLYLVWSHPLSGLALQM